MDQNRDLNKAGLRNAWRLGLVSLHGMLLGIDPARKGQIRKKSKRSGRQATKSVLIRQNPWNPCSDYSTYSAEIGTAWYCAVRYLPEYHGSRFFSSR